MGRLTTRFVREGNVTILRVTEGSLNRETGLFNPSTEEQVIFQGNIQPATDADLERAPEGARLTGMKVIYLREELKDKDILLHKGKRYQVESIDDWEADFSTLPHYRYLAQLEGDDI